VSSTLVAYLIVYLVLLVSYVLVLTYMAGHPAQPVPATPQSPKAAVPGHA
jgi:cytochrome bd ubiquinol oxidase subunit I